MALEAPCLAFGSNAFFYNNKENNMEEIIFTDPQLETGYSIWQGADGKYGIGVIDNSTNYDAFDETFTDIASAKEFILEHIVLPKLNAFEHMAQLLEEGHFNNGKYYRIVEPGYCIVFRMEKNDEFDPNDQESDQFSEDGDYDSTREFDSRADAKNYLDSYCPGWVEV